MIQIIKSYFSIIYEALNVYTSWEIFPGVNYLEFICAAAIMTILLTFIFNGVKDELDWQLTLDKKASRANELSDRRKELRKEKS